MTKIYINCGELALDNGQSSPMQMMFDVANAIDHHCLWLGHGYGGDYIEFDDSLQKTVIDMLYDTNLPFKFEDSSEWMNIRYGSEAWKRLNRS